MVEPNHRLGELLFSQSLVHTINILNTQWFGRRWMGVVGNVDTWGRGGYGEAKMRLEWRVSCAAPSFMIYKE